MQSSPLIELIYNKTKIDAQHGTKSKILAPNMGLSLIYFLTFRKSISINAELVLYWQRQRRQYFSKSFLSTTYHQQNLFNPVQSIHAQVYKVSDGLEHEIWTRCHPILRRSLLIPFRRGYKPLNRYTLRGSHFTDEHRHDQLGNRLVRDMVNVRKFLPFKICGCDLIICMEVSWYSVISVDCIKGFLS